MNQSAIEPETLPPAPNSGGRPSKFTRETVERVLLCLEKGLPMNLAANAAGISTQTLYNYRDQHAEFDKAVEEAIARGVEKRLDKILEASEKGDWRASAWLLEHTKPDSFAKNRVEVTGAGGAPLVGAVTIYLPQKEEGVDAAVLDTKEVTNGNGE